MSWHHPIGPWSLRAKVEYFIDLQFQMDVVYVCFKDRPMLRATATECISVFICDE